MKFKRLSILASLFALPIAACGGDGGGEGNPDLTPEGESHQYVMSSLDLPENVTEATELGFDLDANGSVDNQLGRVISTLASAGGVDVQLAVDEQVAQAGFVLLMNVQAKDLTNSDRVGVKVFLADSAQVAACVDENDTVCGLHLDGSTSFTIDADSPQNALIVGNITNGRFAEAAPGTVTIQIALDDASAPLELSLDGARLEVAVSADGLMSGKLGGAIAEDTLTNQVLPAVAGIVDGVLADEGCLPAPDCCPAGSTGETLLSLFDADMNCEIALSEIQENALINSLLSPDVDLDGDGTEESVSLGVKFEAVGAAFDPILP